MARRENRAAALQGSRAAARPNQAAGLPSQAEDPIQGGSQEAAAPNLDEVADHLGLAEGRPADRLVGRPAVGPPVDRQVAGRRVGEMHLRWLAVRCGIPVGRWEGRCVRPVARPSLVVARRAAADRLARPGVRLVPQVAGPMA